MRLLLIVITLYCYSINVAYSQQPYQPIKTTEQIQLDGKLDENCWKLAPIEQDFMQTSPVAGPPTTEKTIYQVVYDDDFMYVAIISYDSDPSKIIRTEMQRDFSLGADDGTGVTIDTYNDKTTGLCFVANTLDARFDATITQDGGNLTDSYNTYWDAKAALFDSGYITEYRIPFSSLRFEAKASVIMGFRVARLIKRKNELTTSPPCDPNTENAWANLSFAREIEFKNLKGKNPLYISPYVIGNYNEFSTLNADSSAYVTNSQFMQRKNFVTNETLDKIISNIGIDAKYGITKNLILDLSLNTDFAQAEVDDRIINLSKYEVNLPEKRSFFLESANNLSFGFPSGNTLFISRKIGRENGIIVPIIGGARLTGKVNGWQIGALNMQTTGIAAESISPHNFTVLRTRKDIDSLGSFVGGIFTNKINTDTTNLSNQVFGLDFVKRLNQQLAVEGGIATTLDNFGANQVLSNTYFHAGVFKAAVTGFVYNATVDILGNNVNPEMGFIDDNDYGNASTEIGYRYATGEKSKLQFLYVYSNYQYRIKLDNNKMETFSADLRPGMQFKNGASINFSIIEYKIDSLISDWYIDENNAISAGKYTTFNNSLELTTPSQSRFYGSIAATYGGFYSGDRLFVSPYISYSVNKHLSFSLTYEYNNIQFDSYLTDTTNTEFTSNLIRWNITYNFTTKISLKFYTQFDDLSNQLSSNLRFRYNPEEGTDLFVVFNQGVSSDRNRLEPNLPIVDNQAVTVKFIKTFAL